MKPKTFDLNLLQVVVALDATRSVTGAAQELGMSQPGLSTALARLRKHFGDPMFVRTSEGMRPTPANAPGDRLSLEQIMLPARDGLMPDLRGMSARKALISINRIGLTPRIEGSGLVIEQTPEPGASLIPGDVAVLKLGRRTTALPAGGTEQ